jgi:colicin import membrane protein
MKGPSLQKTTAVSAALHATIFLMTMVVLKHSNNFVMPSAYTVSLVSLPGGRAETTSVSSGESVQTVPKMSERADTAANIVRKTREKEKLIDDRISEIALKKKRERIAKLRNAVVSIKGVSTQSSSRVKSSNQASRNGFSGGRAGEMTYADKVGSEIREKGPWSYPDYMKKKDLEAVVAIRISKDGTISITDIEKRSGDRIFDRSVLKAIEMASPVTPPPYDGMEIGLRFTPEP